MLGAGLTAPLVAAEPRTLLWGNEFDGPAGDPPDPTMWIVQTGDGGWGNDELQTYTTDAVALDGEGALAITARIEEVDGETRYTSGRITSQSLGSFVHGRLEARIRLPEGQGLLPAFWLLGDDLYLVGWPESGEIDVVETPNDTSTSVHHVHGPSDSPSGKASAAGSLRHATRLADDYHVYAVERTPGRIELSVDGEVALVATEEEWPTDARWVFDKPFHALFSLAIGGRWPGPPDETTPAASVLSIDWIRLYAPAEATP